MIPTNRIEQLIKVAQIKAEWQGLKGVVYDEKDFESITVQRDGEVAVIFSGYNRGAWSEAIEITDEDWNSTPAEALERYQAIRSKNLRVAEEEEAAKNRQFQDQLEAKERAELARLQIKYGYRDQS